MKNLLYHGQILTFVVRRGKILEVVESEYQKGMVFRQQTQTHPAGEHYQIRLDCSGLCRGEYVLYLNVNGQVVGNTVSL